MRNHSKIGATNDGLNRRPTTGPK